MSYRKSPIQREKEKNIAALTRTAGGALPATGTGIPNEAIAAFIKSILGRVVLPGSPDYNEKRIDFNNLYPAFPQLIVYVKYYEDVKLSLAFARKYDLQLAIRSGGHSFADYSVCDGMIIDLSCLKNIHIDRSDNTATIEAGCRFEDILPRIEYYDLHMPSGGCPTVGIAGYMQGGGYGLTSRMFGMNCDCVVEFTMMLANGSMVVANENEETDLFWAVRGGTGGNFGVLLSIKYRLYELKEIWGIKITWVIDKDPVNAARAMYVIQEQYLSGGLYPQLGIETILATDTDCVKKVFFCAVWIGSEADMDKALEPLMAIPGADVVLRESGRYSTIGGALLGGIPAVPEGAMAYSRSIYIARSLQVNDWKDILTTFHDTAPNKYTMVDMEGYGGKINSIPADTNAFVHRDVKLDFFCLALFDQLTNDQQKNEEWLEWFFGYMARYGNGRSYQNYPYRNQKDFRSAYWGDSYNRLLQVKRKYDPDNFFFYGQSIDPEKNENKASG